jgi:hypothetical protein
VSVADQFVFGYRNGHCLLSGSRELTPESLAALLSVTDAAMADGSQPLITGLALKHTAEYALIVTWSAAEVARPGAVWAHALIVAEASLHDPHAIDVLLGLPRRPTPGVVDLARYGEPLALDGAPARPSYLPSTPVARELLGRLAVAAYAPGAGRLITGEDLGGAAKAVLALWRAQWPELRSAFSFRTREVIRAGAPGFDLTVARRVRDSGAASSPVAAPPVPAWVDAVVDDAVAATPTPLRNFLWAFGPREPREPSRLAALAGLWLCIVARDAAGARARVHRDWNGPPGDQLKRILFAREHDAWWAGREPPG